MAVVRYVMDLGLANAGGAPSFAGLNCHFLRLDTLAAITAPAIVEIADGKYYFEYDFDTAPSGVDSIDWKITFGGVEDSGVISGVAAPGAFVPGPSIGTYSGYGQVGEIVARAAVRCGILALNQTQCASYDPFAASDQNVILMLELLRSLGSDLCGEIKAGLYKTGTITTAASATVYPVPSDFAELADDTAWQGFDPLDGPVSHQRAAFLQAWSSTSQVLIPFQLQTRNFVFPVAPADGLTITYRYVSTMWVQSAGAVSGDKTSPTTRTDTILFDDELVILGLRLRWREDKGFDTTSDLRKYLAQLESAKGQASGAQALSLNGSWDGQFLLSGNNLPGSPWGQP